MGQKLTTIRDTVISVKKGEGVDRGADECSAPVKREHNMVHMYRTVIAPSIIATPEITGQTGNVDRSSKARVGSPWIRQPR